ncbi:hypothetical protein AJ80_04687 [Polytolypa hystricis UAMH7299]|uniref:DUF7791 domain-containing protein n=1 Tax=Polytolypa hystricis (strain UAMH7299) TaxID=1447883 RepID=A0A2B7Y1B9_POLH7|nr:hypothetical protein AJ80_04687 [Polytolypa hystricis UAMH7299]
MAELAALGLACNIIQFIDFGLKLFHDGREIYGSAHGNTAEYFELKEVAQDLATFTNQLHSNNVKFTSSVPAEKSLQGLARKCEELAIELVNLLQELQVKPGRSRKWSSFKQALKRVQKEKEIQNLEDRLRRFREEISVRLLDILNNKQSSALRALSNLSDQNRRLNANTTQRLDEIKLLVLQQANNAKANQSAELRGLGNDIRALIEEKNRVESQQRVLRSLHFETIRETFKSAHKDTFQWVFKDDKINFNKWLWSGNGIYWIRGKAGSEKSTLMKYLPDHENTITALKGWAGNSDLITLLYQIFKQCPDLIEQRSIANCSSNVEVLFFIDGLDEYVGDHTQLTETLKQMVHSPSIKICASSRPWNEFRDAFKGSDKTLKLEDFTKQDIEYYVEDKLRANQKFRDLQSRDPKCKEIVDEIVNKAQGVFLWVFLVVGLLLKGLIDGDEVSDMQERLRYIPSDLEEYFKRIIRNIPEFYREEAIQCFEIATISMEPLPLLAYWFLRKPAGCNQVARIQRLPDEDVEFISKKTKVRLNARCKDLLEVYTLNDSPPFLKYKVDFLHRAVRDFFLETDTMERLKKESRVHFDAPLSLCRVLLSLSKATPINGNLPRADDNHFLIFLSFASQLMGQAREIESYSLEPIHDRLVYLHTLLDELDRVASERSREGEPHWTNFGKDNRVWMVEEYGQKSLLALAIQFHLFYYVESKLEQTDWQAKRGRPLLDYALVSYAFTPTGTCATLTIKRIVRLLLEKGTDPNQPIYICDNNSVWVSFLLCCGGSTVTNEYISPRDLKALYGPKELSEVIEILLRHGADPNVQVPLREAPGASRSENFITVERALRGSLEGSEFILVEELLAEMRQSRSVITVAWTKARGFVNYMLAYS